MHNDDRVRILHMIDAAESVEQFAVSHSSAYWVDHIEAKDVGSVLDRHEHTLPSQCWIGIQYLVHGLAAREFLENQFDGDAGPFYFGLTRRSFYRVVNLV